MDNPYLCLSSTTMVLEVPNPDEPWVSQEFVWNNCIMRFLLLFNFLSFFFFFLAIGSNGFPID
jgi:hypothetical protein